LFTEDHPGEDHPRAISFFERGLYNMAKKKDGVNKSEAVRELLTQNPKMETKEVIDTLGQKGIEVKAGLIYLIRGKMRKKKRRQVREKVAQVTGKSDPVAMIRKVKALAEEAGGLGKLKALVDVMVE
jgi:hypothetical protein